MLKALSIKITWKNRGAVVPRQVNERTGLMQN
jgi:hypothetical protein